MKVLVFGKTGQVARELQRRGDVIALGRDEADFTRPDTCLAALETHKPDTVINAAAYTAVDKAEGEEALATQINGETPGLLAKACARRNVPFVHISTDYVFDGSGRRPWRECDPVAPQNAYGRSKLAGERAVEKAGGAHVILRTAWVFSAHGNNFLRTMLRLSEARDRLGVVDDQIGGPTPAAAIADACLNIARALIHAPEKSGIYHFSGQPEVSWKGFAEEIFARANLPVQVAAIASSEYPTPARRPANSRLDCALIKTRFAITRPEWRKALDAVLEELAQSG